MASVTSRDTAIRRTTAPASSQTGETVVSSHWRAPLAARRAARNIAVSPDRARAMAASIAGWADGGQKVIQGRPRMGSKLSISDNRMAAGFMYSTSPLSERSRIESGKASRDAVRSINLSPITVAHPPRGRLYRSSLVNDLESGTAWRVRFFRAPVCAGLANPSAELRVASAAAVRGPSQE